MPSKPTTIRRRKLDAEDERDLRSREVRANIAAGTKEYRAGKSRPAEEIERQLDDLAQEVREARASKRR